MWLMANATANPNNAGSAAYAYMQLLGVVALGHMWLLMAKASHEVLDGGASDTGFYEAKLITARYYGESQFPLAGALRRKIEAGSEALMAMPAEAF